MDDNVDGHGQVDDDDIEVGISTVERKHQNV